MNYTLETIDHHRNGVFGEPFHAVVFRDPGEGRMIGIVFDSPRHVAVFCIDKLAQANFAFGDNSWRGDHYEPFLRSVIAQRLTAEASS